MDAITLHVLIVAFIATLIRSTFGFGEALIAVPLLALSIPIGIATPVAVLLSITIAATVVVQDWQHVQVRSVAWLLIPTIIGIPLGLVVLTNPHHALVKAILGIFIIAFSGIFLIGRKPPELASENRIWLLVCGFLAGVFGGAFGMNGPPLVIYGAMRRWSPKHFRATLQGYFLPAGILGMVGYRLTGLWTPAVTHYYLIALPAAIPAIFLGRSLNHRMHGDAFLKYVYAGLVVIGSLLIYQAVQVT